MIRETSPLRVGIGGPVGSGKTALTLSLCLALRDRYELAVVTNDIYTEEDAQFLVPEGVYEHFAESFGARGKKLRTGLSGTSSMAASMPIIRSTSRNS